MTANLAFSAPNLPARYNAMCRAIDAAYEVDEVKDIRDKAAAMQMYFRQARNTEAERRACEIRLRAERKASELYDSQEKAKGAAQPGIGRAGGTRSDGPTALHELGVTKQQMSEWRQLRAVPDKDFEAALADPDVMPTAAGIIRAATAPRRDPVSRDALWLWGRLKDFDRDGLLNKRPADVLATMTPEMLDEVHVLVPRVAAWLKQIGRLSP